ncbi:MAG: hypothetical protein IKU47_08205 [Oscillospiraceae bacterium]|nr:hypothetical protein [Oscillospiraceae bacterium]
MAQYINSNKPFVFSLNFNPNETEELEITFLQFETKIVKTKSELEKWMPEATEENGLWLLPFAFTIEESNRFEPNEEISVQIKVVIGGIQDYTNMVHFMLSDILEEVTE